MAINHKDHDHPNTPAARAACRKAMAINAEGGLSAVQKRIVNTAISKAQMTVVPRKRGDGGVVRGMKDAAPKNVKKPNTYLRKDYDLVDVPRMLAYGVRLAWDADLDVMVGDRFREDEARIVIKADLGEISLVWKDKRPHGLWAIWVRNYDSSKQYKVESVQHALDIMVFDSKAWDEDGNLVNP